MTAAGQLIANYVIEAGISDNVNAMVSQLGDTEYVTRLHQSKIDDDAGQRIVMTHIVIINKLNGAIHSVIGLIGMKDDKVVIRRTLVSPGTEELHPKFRRNHMVHITEDGPIFVSTSRISFMFTFVDDNLQRSMTIYDDEGDPDSIYIDVTADEPDVPTLQRLSWALD